jgi:hypothetical protein
MDDKVGLSSKIRKVAFDPEDGIKVLLYGQSGTGKTSLWGTFPKPILSLICSGGTNSGECRTLEGIPDIYQFSLDKSEEIEQLFDEGLDRFRTLVLDHCTGFQDLILTEVVGLEDVPVQKGWGTASQQQWGQISLLCKERIRRLLGFDGNVVIISQERTFNAKDEVQQLSDVIRPFVGAAQTPTLTGWLNTACDYVCQTFKRAQLRVDRMEVAGQVMEQTIPTGKVEYCLRTGPSVEATTKFRVPRRLANELPDVIVDPTYDKLVALIGGKKGAANLSPKRATK